MKTLGKFVLGLALAVCISSTSFAQEDASVDDVRSLLEAFVTLAEVTGADSNAAEALADFEAFQAEVDAIADEMGLTEEGGTVTITSESYVDGELVESRDLTIAETYEDIAFLMTADFDCDDE